MSQSARIVTYYLCRRKRRYYVSGEADVTDELWLVVVIGPQQDADAVPKWVLNPVLDAGVAEDLGERLNEALAESMADRIAEMTWKIDDGLSDGQIADLVASLPDSVKTIVQEKLDGLAQVAGVPAPVALLGADVTATLVLSPVLKPVENGLHTLEIVGIVIGLITGLHPLVIACAKHLAHDEFGSMLATAIKQAMKSPSSQTLADSGAADHEATQPQEPTLPTVSSFGGDESAKMTDSGISADLSPETVRAIADLKQALRDLRSPTTSTPASVEATESPRTLGGLSALG